MKRKALTTPCLGGKLSLRADGLPAPNYMEGNALSDLFWTEALRKRPVAYAEAELQRCPKTRGPAAATEAQEEAVKDRLRGLGYV